MKARFKKYTLFFKRPAGTSRGTYKTRDSWFLFIEENGKLGIGECAPLPGLSIEDPTKMDSMLHKVCEDIELYQQNISTLAAWPSIIFGLETALLDLANGGSKKFYNTEFAQGKSGIPINGLIWMGDIDFMKLQIKEKLDHGFDCIKLKIGALDFERELEIIKGVRNEFSSSEITIRVDANGGFNPKDALEKLKRLAEFDIHSIEQPIQTKQWDLMYDLCKKSPLAIALDEELIGINSSHEKIKLLEQIKPDYIVLKPSLHGGISGCDKWIELADKFNIGWWITSYLESNIGLNALAQWASSKEINMQQGLGTGQLFSNNIDSPLEIRKDKLWYNSKKSWDVNCLNE